MKDESLGKRDKNMAGEKTAPRRVVTPSAWRILWNEIYSDKLALFSLFFFIILVLTIFIWAAQYDLSVVNRVNLRYRNLPWGHEDFFLGTDPMGRDIIPLLVIGARNSLAIGLTVAVINSVIGIFVGLFAGFYGGHVDNVVMRLIDFFTMVPTLMVQIMLLAILTSSVPNMILVFVIFGWLGMARSIRMITLQQGVLDYVKASKTLGTYNIVIIFREVLPNVVAFIVINLTLTIASVIGIETALTILGFGLPLTTPSLGTLVSWAMDALTLQNRPWQWLPAATLVLVMVLCINYIGQALNRAADARRRRV